MQKTVARHIGGGVVYALGLLVNRKAGAHARPYCYVSRYVAKRFECDGMSELYT